MTPPDQARPTARPSADPRLIVPLDVPTRQDAESLVASLDDAVSFYKIGLQLFASQGMDLAVALKAAGKQVFLDWKLHDIGATVEKATAAVVASGACDLLTVHAEPQVLAAAVKGRSGDRTARILGVTVLTSLDDPALVALGYALTVRELVERRIRQVIDAGADGVVASPQEADLARRIGGPEGSPGRRGHGRPGPGRHTGGRPAQGCQPPRLRAPDHRRRRPAGVSPGHCRRNGRNTPSSVLKPCLSDACSCRAGVAAAFRSHSRARHHDPHVPRRPRNRTGCWPRPGHWQIPCCSH